MYKTKIFFANYSSDLERDINRWYSENINIKVLFTNLSSVNSNFIFQITYKTLK